MAEHIIEFVIETSETQYLDIQPINLKTKLNIIDHSQTNHNFCAPNSINIRGLYQPVDFYIMNTSIKPNDEDYKSYADWINNNQPAMK